MGESLVSGALVLAVLFGSGWVVRRGLRLDGLGLAEPLVALVLGSLCAALPLVLLVALDAPLTPWTCLPPAIAAAASAWWLARRVHGTTPAPAPRIAPVWWVAAALWCALAVDTAALANAAPIVQGDEAHIWSATAQALWGASGSDASITDLLRGGRVPGSDAPVLHSDYPRLAPLLQCLVHATCGEVARVAARFPAQAFAVCAVLALFEVLRRSGARTVVGLAFASAVAFTPAVLDLCETAMAESLVFAGVALLALATLVEQRTSRMLATVALVLLVAAKNEGLAIALCWSLAQVATTGGGSVPRLVGALPALPALALALAHWLVNAHLGLANDLVAGTLGGDAGLDLRVASAGVVRDVLLAPSQAGALAVVALVLTGLAYQRARRAAVDGGAVPLACALAGIGLWSLVAGTYWLVLVTTPNDANWHWATAGPRIFANLLPLSALAAAVAAGHLWPRPGRRD